MNIKLSVPVSPDLADRLSDHMLRIIQRHVVAPRIPVGQAKDNLSGLLESALDGKCQVIGKRDPALLMSYDELAEMLLEASRPATWGEAFEPTAELPGIAEPLMIREDAAPRQRFLMGGEAAEEARQPEDNHLKAGA